MGQAHGQLLKGAIQKHTAQKTWTANARADGESGPLNAYERAFVEVDLQTVCKPALELANP